jgi:D-alanyl-D-alanine carboxypeptidase/D-alanyl-D-alanine-endopeptidase (penicillin-binding protein 4)
LLSPFLATAQSRSRLAQRVEQLTRRPEFKHAWFGIEFYDITAGRVTYALNGDKLFVPGSTTKLFTEGTALAVLGSGYRFHTQVYRTGPVTPDGVLHGDLVLLAGGDPNLSARVGAGDTLGYTDNDHSYAGSLPGAVLPGDPLGVLKKLAEQVAAHGIKRVQGLVLVDTSLFAGEKPEPATGAMISPIVVNDNIVDVTVTPGTREGRPTSISMAPLTPYLTIVNKTATGPPRSETMLHFSNDTSNSDGSHSVTLEGNVPAGWETALIAYKVKTPAHFAECAFVVALNVTGIQALVPPVEKHPDSQALAAAYTPENLVAEHVSAPLKAEVKVTLKVSQNLHAALTPYLLGALAARKPNDALQAGLDLEHDYLKKAGLDMSAAAQADGVGGPGTAFSPDFMARYLAHISKQSFADDFKDALSIMGRDGTLADIQAQSPAVGHVRAKSGTYVYYNPLNHNLLMQAKGLAGYVETRRGHRLAFALFVNQIVMPNIDKVEGVGELLGGIVSAAYETE